MDRVRIEPATREHARMLARTMRQADANEVWAAAGVMPLTGLVCSLGLSEKAWSGFYDDRLVCMFGVSRLSLLSGQGAPWMLGSEDLPKYAIPFLRRNRDYVEDMRQGYEALVNYVDARNLLSIRWLKWLGFTIEDPQPWGPFRLPFHRFTMEGKAACAS